jgi:hypothetical protein
MTSPVKAGADEHIDAVITHEELTSSRRNGQDSGLVLTVFSPGRHKKRKARQIMSATVQETEAAHHN